MPFTSILIVAIGVVAWAPGWAEETTVSPGSVVGWPGVGVERCSREGLEWKPLAGRCWYPIDLLEPEGEISVVRWREGSREERSLRVGSYPYDVQYITLEDDSKVDLSAESLRRVQQENGKIASLWGLRSPRRFDLPLGPPMAPLPAAGRFGARRFFNNQPRNPHTGADYSADLGTHVLAVAPGVVVLTGDFFFPGKSVFVDHGDGLISMYFHLSGIAVEEGDEVRVGEIVGLVGQSGRATGPHLHFGVRWHGSRLDPALLLGPLENVPSIAR